MAYLRRLGIPIPPSGNRLGTLRVEVSGSSDLAVSVRTTTSVREGRAGLAYPGIATSDGFEEAVYLCGLRQNGQDRSNVAVQNAGSAGEESVTLRVTVFSGDPASAGRRTILPDRTLSPGGFHQYDGILNEAGFDNGYVKVERVKGTPPFYAYGVINDQANSDGSFVFPVTARSLEGVAGQTLPVIVENQRFTSELMVTNFSEEARTLHFSFVADGLSTPDHTARFNLTIGAGQQRIIPDVIDTQLRRKGVEGVSSSRGGLTGALFATRASDDMSGIVIGARTSSSDGRGGQYGVFYHAVPNGAAFTKSVWVDGLQQNAENRSNLALVNTGEVDDSPSIFQLDVYDGTTGMLANTVTGLKVTARGWRQINGILGKYAPGTTQGYVRISKISGNNPFLAYGVINDGGTPGQRSGDGAYLPATVTIIDPGTEAMKDREVLEALYHATSGPHWSNRTHWLSAAPLSEWYGVGTDGSGRVTSLALGYNGLSGTIPPSLGQLARLERLGLGGNELRGGIPTELGDLTNLQELNLAINELSGAIPNNLQQLSELTTLDIRDTDICVPTDAAFQAWLGTISTFFSSGLVCDGTRRVLFSAESYEVKEGETVTVAVRLIDQTGDPVRSVEIALTAMPGGGATAADYSGVPKSVTITAPATEAGFVFTAVADDPFDDGETVVLGFRRPLSSGVTAGSPDTATVTIIDPGTEAMKDREVLEAFFHATGGPEWRNRTHWLSALPLSEWHGVGTDESGRVTSLYLGANGLSGRIPPELGGLTHLQGLHLQINELSGGIPPELGRLTHLQVLDLAFNQLSGGIPPELGALTHLQRLYLQVNELSGGIPPELGALVHLLVLELAINELSGPIPPELGGLSRLEGLYLGNNELSGPIPLELAKLTQLQMLHLRGNQLRGEIPPGLGGLTHLQWLSVKGNKLSGAIPKNLQQLSELTLLDIRETDICVPTDAAFQAWLETISRFFSSGLVCDGTRRVLFSASSYEVTEGKTVTVSVYLIDRTGDPVRPTVISLTAMPGGEATAADYSGIPERVTITAPLNEASFVVTAVKDDPFDPGETVVLGFRRPLPSGVTAGSPDTTTVTIHDPGTEGVTDREVLEVLYRTTGGPDWSNRTNWLSAAPLSEWHGVGTDGSGRVTSLALSRNGLSGTIPPALGQLTRLNSLELGYNELSGEIPPELGGLTTLQELDLGNNKLSGGIPSELGGLTTLQRLNLWSNQLRGEIPPELGGLTHLQELGLEGNQLSGGIPPELGSLTTLQRLNLCCNGLRACAKKHYIA